MGKNRSMVRACVSLVLVNCFIIIALTSTLHILKIIAIALLIRQSFDHILMTRRYLEENES